MMALCHPEIAKIKSSASNWGCEDETAISKYLNIYLKKDYNWEVKECGFFFINTGMSYIGTLPDRLVSCSCCNDRICEI